MSRSNIDNLIGLFGEGRKTNYINTIRANNQNLSIKKFIYLDKLSFNSTTRHLYFEVIEETEKPKITRYVTQNYVRTPIYGDISRKRKVLKKFDRSINPVKFANEEILKLGLDKPTIVIILDAIKMVPGWRVKEMNLEKITSTIEYKKSKIRKFDQEKSGYKFKPTNFDEIKSNFWLRLLFFLPTLGLSFVNYNSKSQAYFNKQLNAKNKLYNENHQKEIDLKNQKLLKVITQFNDEIREEIEELQNKYLLEEAKEIDVVKTDDKGWTDLKTASDLSFNFLNSKIGVYVIWNKTKDKYYVGQSKNMGRRLNQHFKNGDVNNVIFAKDWYENDQFKFKCFECKTKDELDSLEKKFIGMYNAFENGYNKTKGNS